MLIRLKKSKDPSQASTITITRTDGSSTWAKLHRGMETHDLAHYAVEKVLGFKKAFYSIIEAGYNINDFTLPKEARPTALLTKNLDPEALITEHIVNLLEIERYQQTAPEGFLINLKMVLTKDELPLPILLDEQSLARIRKMYLGLVEKWNHLNTNDVLEINF